MSKHPDILPFDLAAFESVSKADSREQTAGDALRIAAGYLRRREPLPPVLADYLADAFEAAAREPEENQIEVLALSLGLMALNRRRAAVRAWEVAQFVDDAGNGPTERQRILSAVEKFGIAETTARRLLKEGRAILAEVATINRKSDAE
jgi:hypothetical protein